MVKVRLTKSFTGMRQFEAAHPKMPSVAEELPRCAFLPTAAAYLAAGNNNRVTRARYRGPGATSPL